MGNKAMTLAKSRKKDEFYTSLDVIEQEMVYYRKYFEGKTIFLNCDDPDWSNFWVYFSLNFDFLGINKLISTHYDSDEKKSSYVLSLEANGKGNSPNEPVVVKTHLKGNGDFRSEECIELLEESDIVITNPPFSLWREYVAQLVEYDKKFIILGNQNAVSYKEVFPLFKDNKIWFGSSISSGDREFRVPDDYPLNASGTRIDDQGNKYIRVKGVRWFTNLDHKKRHEELVLTSFYEGNEDYYPTFDNFNAIEVGVTKEIPLDYTGVMGVPLTFLDKYSPDQFEILGISKPALYTVSNDDALPTKRYTDALQHNKNGSSQSGGKVNDGATLLFSEKPESVYYTANESDGYFIQKYTRIFVRNKKPVSKKDMLGF